MTTTCGLFIGVHLMDGPSTTLAAGTRGVCGRANQWFGTTFIPQGRISCGHHEECLEAK